MNYILFGSDTTFYAQGGGHDFIKTSSDFEGLVEEAKRRKRKEGDEYFEGCLAWWHVMEASSGRIIFGSEEQPYDAPTQTIGTKIKDGDY